MDDTRFISSVEFGLIGPRDVDEMSVCAITIDRTSGSRNPLGTLYDPRMGAVSLEAGCATCHQNAMSCPGHYGHIDLNWPIVHPLPFALKTVLSVLRCVCWRCSKVLVRPQLVEDETLSLSQIEDMSRKINHCWDCRARTYKYSLVNSSTDAHFRVENPCSAEEMLFVDPTYDLSASRKFSPRTFTDREILNVLSNISADDVIRLGFKGENFHPSHLVISKLLVIPPCSRPFIVVNGERCDDDLTLIYRDIIKINNGIRSTNSKPSKNTEESVRVLKYYVSSLMDNTKGRLKHPNGREKKGIKERLSTKHGLFRSNLIGKRTNYSARTVVGGDPSLRADEIAVPGCIADEMTVSETVTAFNIHALQSLLDTNRVEFVTRQPNSVTGEPRRRFMVNLGRLPQAPIAYGDRIRRNGELVDIDHPRDLVDGDEIVRFSATGQIEDVVVFRKRQRRPIRLKIGDEVSRCLMDGDYVIVNRQPTLHIGSMLGVRVKVFKDRRSLGIPLNITTPMNCDFDGDENNIYVPQTPQAKIEYSELACVRNNIVSGQSSKPIMGINQDCLLGGYLMTQGWIPVEVGRFNDILTSLDVEYDPEEMKRIDGIAKKYGGGVYTTRGLLSLTLPKTFCYTHTASQPKGSPSFKIIKGVFVRGMITKHIVGASSGSIHHYLDSHDAVEFLTRFQFVVNAWIRDEGVSVGFGDCIPSTYDGEGYIPEVKETIEKCFMKTDVIEHSGAPVSKEDLVTEIRINSILNGARDVGKRLAKECIDPGNRFLPLIDSGSKGSISNLTQIMGLLGQQNVGGKRIEETCIEGKRSLTCYDFNERDVARRLESRGFIRHSFFSGLNPREYWFHAVSGREGTIITSESTPRTGYCQNKITEMLKNLTARYDYSVRTSDGHIVQFLYGGDGLSPAKQKRSPIGLKLDILNAIEQFNVEYEEKIERSEDGLDDYTDDEVYVDEGDAAEFEYDDYSDVSEFSADSGDDEY